MRVRCLLLILCLVVAGEWLWAEEQESQHVSQLRMVLKAQGRLEGIKDVRDDYQEAFQKFPKSEGLRADFLDLLIDAKKFHEANEVLWEYIQVAPHQEREIRRYHLAIFLGQKKWGEAKPLLATEVQDNPENLSYKKDLAFVLWRAGEGRQALQLYEEVWHDNPHDRDVQDALWELKQIFHHRLAPRFEVYRLGSNHRLTGELKLRGFLSPAWEYWGLTQGIYFDNTLANNEWVQAQQLGLLYHFWPAWSVGLDVEGTMGAPQDTFSPEVLGSFEIFDQLVVKSHFAYRRSWRDPIEAVSAGGLYSEAGMNFLWHVVKPLYLSGEYNYDRYRINGGLTAEEHRGQGGVEYIFLERPTLGAAYRFVFGEVTRDQGLLNVVPLIPKNRTHYLELNYRQRFYPDWEVYGTFFVGGDPERDLNFIKAELIGVRTGALWSLLPHWDLRWSYEYSRESLVRTSGQLHLGSVSLEYHW